MKRTIEFNDEHSESIKQLENITGKDLAGLISLSFGLLQVCLKEIGKGNKICCVNSEGEPVKEITGIIDEPK